MALCAPAQAVAFAARSSLASLPAMVESAQLAKMPPVVSGFILPLAASIFRVGGAVAMPVGALFVARLYGLPLSSAQLAAIALTSDFELVHGSRHSWRQHHRARAGDGVRESAD